MDLGLAKGYLNKTLFNDFLASERVKDVDMFYEIELLSTTGESEVLFESEKISLKNSISSLLQWN